MTTDFRSLCARMAAELDHYRQLLMDDRREVHPLAAEARAALAESQPEGPTDEDILRELIDIADEAILAEHSSDVVDAGRRLLARWGTQQ